MNKPVYDINKIQQYSFLQLSDLLKELSEYYFKSFDFKTKGFSTPPQWHDRSKNRNEIRKDLQFIEAEFEKKSNPSPRPAVPPVIIPKPQPPRPQPIPPKREEQPIIPKQ